MPHVYRVTLRLRSGGTVQPLIAATDADGAAAKASELYAARRATVRAVELEDEPRQYRQGRQHR